jgi:hypothetical protein
VDFLTGDRGEAKMREVSFLLFLIYIDRVLLPDDDPNHSKSLITVEEVPAEDGLLLV